MITVKIDINPASEVFPLAKHVAASLQNVAPERRSELLKTSEGLVVRLTDDGFWTFQLALQDRSIIVSRKSIEYLWISAYTYFILYDEFYRRENAGESLEGLDIANDPRVRGALDLLGFIMKDLLKDEDHRWPAGPRPMAGSDRYSDDAVADELCLVALGFLLHHEYAHRRLQHGAGSSIEQEREADDESASWLLDAVELMSNQEIKRSLGMGVALTSLVAIGIHSGNHDGTTHPADYERLFATMDRYLGNIPEHTSWLLVSTALKLHLSNNGRGIQVPEHVFETPREAVDTYVKTIAAAARNRGESRSNEK